MVVVCDILLYLSLSIILGTWLLNLVPEHRRPMIHVPRPILIGAMISLPFITFPPLLQLILYYYKDDQLWQIIKAIVLTFHIGRAWLFIAGISFLMMMTSILRLPERVKSYAGLIYTILIIMGLGWSSHAASMSLWKGFITHTAHMLSVTVWVGVLLMVGWFSDNAANWRAFLRWYHPLAVSCVIVAIIAGFMLMTSVVKPEHYVAAWVVSYGQALFIKHLLIIPLLVYAIINGLLLRIRLLKLPAYNPRPWVRAESIIIFFIFAATAVLGSHSPPHNIAAIINFEGPARLFTWLKPGLTIEPDIFLTLQFNALSISLLVIAIISLASIIMTYRKKGSAWLTLFSSIVFVVTSYIGLMSAV